MEALKRHIQSGKAYDKYFSNHQGRTINLPKADVHDTLAFMEQLVNDTLTQTKAISNVLQGSNLNQTCQHIFDFLYRHIQYKPDATGIEQLRTPNRAWADRATGIDCDCYSIFISSILTNLGIAHGFRITKYNGKPNYQHVYVVVPKDGQTISNRSSYYVIDPVLDGYNQEKTFSAKYDKMMKIPHQILNGVQGQPYTFGNEFNHLSGLGSTTDDFLASTKAHLLNTLNQLEKNPNAFQSVVSPSVFKEQLIYVLENWNDPVAREGALEEMAEMEDLGESQQTMDVRGIGRANRLTAIEAKTKVQMLRKRRQVQRRVVPATIQRGTLNDTVNFPTVLGYYNGVQGLHGLDGFFKRVWSGVKKTASKVGSTVKKVTTKVGDTAKKIGQGIVRYNPLTIASRNGLLVVMRLNLFGLAKKLKYGYLTEAQARAKNMNIIEWRKVRDAVGRMDKLFTSIGGKSENLRKAILTGKAGGINGLGEPVTASAVTASAGLVATITAWLKKIDFGKLFQTAKKAVDTTRQIRTAFRPSTSFSPATQISVAQPTVPTQDPIVPSVTLPEIVVTADRPITDKPNTKKGGTGLLVGLLVAGAGIALLSKKKKGLAGVVESVAL